MLGEVTGIVFTVLLVVLLIAGIFSTLIGIITIFHWCKTPKYSTNRINNISSWWVGLTRPEVLGECYKYFRQNLLDNVDDVDRANIGE